MPRASRTRSGECYDVVATRLKLVARKSASPFKSRPGTGKRGKPRASYRQSFRLDYRNLEEQLSDGKIANVSLPEIKTAIEQLSFEERAELAAWLHGWNDDEWDEQMKRDIGSGKLDDVLHEVEEDIKSGHTREMP